MQQKILTQYSLFKFGKSFWSHNPMERRKTLKIFIKNIKEAAETTSFYQVYPSRKEFDLMVWSNVQAEELDAPGKFFTGFVKAVNPTREYIRPDLTFWGLTKPSMYSKAKRSPQEIDPFEGERLPYFIVYPFSKTTEWYLKPREERQEMMNDHIRIGKQYPEITQLLLYSFGLQDQEFVVAYETKDMSQFSDLVYVLRSTKARDYTLADTPIITGTLRSEEELLTIV
jgi:chlorite dismutase